jgi:sugar phosphate isomerase/epimerase
MTADLGAGILRVFLAWPGSTPLEGGGARYDLAQKAWDAAHEGLDEERIRAWCRECLVEAARWAGEAGVTLALQNHRPLVRSYRQVLQMVREVGSPHLKVCLDAPLMERKDAAFLRQAVEDAGPLQVQTHYFGEFERPSAGDPIRLVDKRGAWRGPFERHGYVEENFYRPFVEALLATGYRGFIGYELCSPLPVVEGRTVGLDYVDGCVELALEFMRETIAEARRALAASARPPVPAD